MMSLIINAVIITGIFHCYQGLKSSWKQGQSYLKNQEIHHIVFQYLKKDIQTAGYRGCRTRDMSFPLYPCYSAYNSEYRHFRFDQTLFGFQASSGNCYGKMPPTACERVEQDSSVLILYNVPQKIMPILEKLKNTSDPLPVSNPIIQKKSLALVSDCLQGDLFIVTDFDEGKIYHQKILGLNQTEHFSKCYSDNAEVVELQTVAYYLAKPLRYQNQKNDKNQKLSLFRDDFLNPAEEVVADILSMEIAYGILPENIENKLKKSEIQYKKAEQIINWHKVVSVRLKIVTELEKNWEIEFALRNRLDPDVYVSHVNRFFFPVTSCHNSTCLGAHGFKIDYGVSG